MAIDVRLVPNAITFGVARAFNSFVRSYVDSETTFSHYDITSTPGGDYTNPTSTPYIITPSSTADLAAVIILAEAARSVLLVHFIDEIAHGEADDTNYDLIKVATVPTATDQTTVNTLLNALKTAYGAHRTQATVHSHDDTTNLITAADATDLASSKLLAADIRVQVNAHVQFAWPSPSLNLIAP